MIFLLSLNYNKIYSPNSRQSFLREAMQGKFVKQDPKDGHARDLLEKIKTEKAKSGKKEKRTATHKTRRKYLLRFQRIGYGVG